ncbi:hypothetical protein [Dietzia sp.]|uniref:hypothetical protein n=1 Tax=Dietzia sp. TaxID=1871616 RepID=UPI002FDA1FA7
MNFRRILLSSAALGSAAVFAAACSNSDNVVLTIPTSDSAETGQQTTDAGSTTQPRKDGRYIARCATEAEGDGYAGQTDFTDGSVDFSDYCLQRYYSGVQPAPGAVFVESDSGKSKPQESSTSPTPDAGMQTAQRVPDGSQLLAEGGGNRSTGMGNGNTSGTTGGLGQNPQPTDNFGAANAGSPTHDGTGDQNGNGQVGNQPGNGQDGNGENGNQPGNGQGGTGGTTTEPSTGGTTTEPGNGGTTTQPTTPGQPSENGGEGGTTTTQPTSPSQPITVPTAPITPIYPDTEPPTASPMPTGSADGSPAEEPAQASPSGVGETPAQDITGTEAPETRPAPISSQVPTDPRSSLEALFPNAN